MHRISIVAVMMLVSSVLGGYDQHDQQQQQYYKTPPPRILSHKQAQNHDGAFKYAYASENGIAHSEIISPDGNRSGGYTYVDPHGKTITVKYTAGKDGFRILEGEHIPRDPHPAHQQQQHAQPAPYYNQPHYNRQDDNDDGSYNPEKYERPEPEPVYAKAQPQYHHQPAAPQPQHKSYEGSSGGASSYYESNLHFRADSHQEEPVYHHRAEPSPAPQHYRPAPPPPPPQHHDYANSVENAKEPDYHEPAGKPHTFGTGYAFQFSS